MQVYRVQGEQFSELGALPAALPDSGFLWVAVARSEFEQAAAELQAPLQRWSGASLVDLHISDLLNQHLPSRFDYTSWYDMMVFRRLASSAGGEVAPALEAGATLTSVRAALQSIDTRPVGFAVFDRVLITVHPAECGVSEHFAKRLSAQAAAAESRGASRMPASPADLMLRMINHMVDGYLDLRRLLTRQLGHLQQELLDPRSEFRDWPVLLESRNLLHMLEDTCEDQRSAVQEWLDALDEWPDETDPHLRRERELLRVRTRDVLEHVERVLTHVRRLEHSAETAVQIHFSALGHRTNAIMRTLTVLTAIFLPLNLITGFFGMNFDSLPLIHRSAGIWVAVLLMVLMVLVLWLLFLRKRYIGTRDT